MSIGETAHLDGSKSTDPDLDPLSYSWAITAKPLGSVATLVNAATAMPMLTPDIEGVYEVTLVVRDFIGPGTPVTVLITSTTAGGFAEFQIVNASTLISGLTSGQITNKGNQAAILNFLRQAVVALEKGMVSTAIDTMMMHVLLADDLDEEIGCRFSRWLDSQTRSRYFNPGRLEGGCQSAFHCSCHRASSGVWAAWPSRNPTLIAPNSG